MANETSGTDQLKDAFSELVRNIGDTALDRIGDTVSGLTEKLTDVGDGAGGVVGKAAGKAGEAAVKGENPVMGGVKGALSGAKDKVKDALPGGGNGDSQQDGGDPTKSTNIVESIEVGVPLSVAYNQWTEFGSFPSFMKKVENVEAEEDEKLKWKAQVFLSHRTWEATIIEQVPDERIVWRSEGEKGHVDGAVTFHEIGPNLTRILVVLEYYPQGFFEKTGNIWRAPGRRARLELKHFTRHVMTRTILEPEEIEGWRGVIRDSEVVETHEEHVEAEEQEASSAESEDESEEYDEEPEAESEEYDEEPEDESEDYDEEPESDEEADQQGDDPEDYEEEPEEEEPDEESQKEPAAQLRRSRRRRAS